LNVNNCNPNINDNYTTNNVYNRSNNITERNNFDNPLFKVPMQADTFYSRYFPQNNGNYIQQNYYQQNLNYNIINADEYLTNKRKASLNKSNFCGISPVMINIDKKYDDIKPRKLDFTNRKVTFI